ncbi:MAG: hypothetical protein L3J62_02505, partial [Gammaproteobacteria bacterium]|nr:hypothetical protein [Gammaproteobacteria bacterium]MCF6229655.1 hypothetical protein [Gammaproteobacteria bacterium]
PRDFMRYVMDGLRFTMLNETPCAEPHAGCCGDWGLETPGYPISCVIQSSSVNAVPTYWTVCRIAVDTW